jgi:hypothetical protein
MTLATAPDVATSLLRLLTATEDMYVPALLDRAEAHLLASIPELLEWAADDETYRETAVSTEADMVARVLRNPDGLVSERGDLYSYRLDLAVASGHLLPTHDELARLRRRGPVGSILPSLDAYAAARFWRDPNAHPFLTGG